MRKAFSFAIALAGLAAFTAPAFAQTQPLGVIELGAQRGLVEALLGTPKFAEAVAAGRREIFDRRTDSFEVTMVNVETGATPKEHMAVSEVELIFDLKDHLIDIRSNVDCQPHLQQKAADCVLRHEIRGNQVVVHPEKPV
jgi:hypothetical protein